MPPPVLLEVHRAYYIRVCPIVSHQQLNKRTRKDRKAITPNASKRTTSTHRLFAPLVLCCLQRTLIRTRARARLLTHIPSHAHAHTHVHTYIQHTHQHHMHVYIRKYKVIHSLTHIHMCTCIAMHPTQKSYSKSPMPIDIFK